MLELASLGAKVLQIRSVEFAKRYQVPVHVRSSFSMDEGTWLVHEDAGMEDVTVAGVTSDLDQTKITILRVPDRPGLAARVFGPIAESNIVVDMIIQNTGAEGFTDSRSIPRGDAPKALALVTATVGDVGAGGVTSDANVAKVSIVGLWHAQSCRCCLVHVPDVGYGRNQRSNDLHLGNWSDCGGRQVCRCLRCEHYTMPSSHRTSKTNHERRSSPTGDLQEPLHSTRKKWSNAEANRVFPEHQRTARLLLCRLRSRREHGFAGRSHARASGLDAPFGSGGYPGSKDRTGRYGDSQRSVCRRNASARYHSGFRRIRREGASILFREPAHHSMSAACLGLHAGCRNLSEGLEFRQFI